jgi:hypothetical protein
VAAETRETPPETPLNVTYVTDTPTARLEKIEKQLDHLDGMVHEIHQFIHDNKGHLEKALRFLDPAASMRDYLRNRPKPEARRGRTPVQ